MQINSNSSTSDSLAKTKILLADDSVDNQVLISHILKRLGANVTIASNGADAVQKAMHGKFDIILMDIQMPVKDGISATRDLREVGYAGPIIALTANVSLEDRILSREAGCNLHLGKPVNVSELFEGIRFLTLSRFN